MAGTHKVEVFSAGCAVCKDAVELVKRLSGASADVTVQDMNDMKVVQRAKQLGIRTVPAVVIDGKLADCCKSGGLEEGVLRAAGLGR